jgi:RHS repeat-associated protein
MYKKQINYTALFKPKASLLAVRREKTLSKLINASYSFMPNERYDFDKNCNRIKAEFQNKEQTYKTAEYNRLISDNDSEYKYDLEGNRIAKISKDGSTIKYYWDNRNRLIKIETPNGTIEYIYDHQNRIVLRKQGDNTSTFIHDGWQIVLQFDNDKPTHRYLWGTKQDELICDNDNWTLCDHLNTVRDIVKSDGTVTDHLEYNSFGKIISATKNDSSLQFAYTGKLTDKESELQWNINRWYDAKVGRWVSEDPIGFESDDSNLFRYVSNGVCDRLDFDGLKFIGDTCHSCIQSYNTCRASAAGNYAACASALVGGGGLLELGGCAGFCSYIKYTGTWFATCLITCTSGSLFLSAYCLLPRCDLGLNDDKMKCGNNYNRCAFSANPNDNGCGPGNENWRPD